MSEPVNWMSVVMMVGVLVLVLPAAIYVFALKTALRNLAIWVAIFAALMWGYHFMADVPRERAAQQQDSDAEGKGYDLPQEENSGPIRHPGF